MWNHYERVKGESKASQGQEPCRAMNVRFFAPCVLRVTAPAPGLRLFMRLLSRPRFRPSRGRAVCRWVWMVVPPMSFYR